MATDKERLEALRILTERINFHGNNDHDIEIWTDNEKKKIVANVTEPEYKVLLKVLHDEERDGLKRWMEK